MKQYSRAKEKKMNLTSVKCHTIDINNDKRVQAARENKRRSVFHDSEDHGKAEHQPGGSGEANWRPAVQRQQGSARENAGEPRVSPENSGEPRSGSGDKVATKEVKDAA